MNNRRVQRDKVEKRKRKKCRHPVTGSRIQGDIPPYVNPNMSNGEREIRRSLRRNVLLRNG